MRRDVFQALAARTRRDIITILCREPQNLNTLANRFPISRPSISRHINILVECGLVLVEKQGRESLCRATPENLDAVQQWLKDTEQFWKTHWGHPLRIWRRKVLPPLTLEIANEHTVSPDSRRAGFKCPHRTRVARNLGA